MGDLRVAFLGAGSIAATHAKHVVAEPNVRLVGVCATSEASAGRMIAKVGGPDARPYSDLDRMLDESRPDAVYVCLPPDAHHGQVERLAERGVHLLLEKPLALSMERARSQAAAAERAGVVTLVGYHLRFTGPVRRVKQLIDDGSAGPATLFAAAYLCNALHSPWWRDASRSGGQLVQQAIHLYDLAVYLMGRPVSISGQVGNLLHRQVEGYTGDDTSAALIGFASGAVGTIAASNCAMPTEWRATATLICKNITADFADKTTGRLTHTRGEPAEMWRASKQRPAVEELSTPDVDPYREQTRHFIDCVRRGSPTITPIRTGLTSLAMVLAARQSGADGGRMIPLKEETL